MSWPRGSGKQVRPQLTHSPKPSPNPIPSMRPKHSPNVEQRAAQPVTFSRASVSQAPETVREDAMWSQLGVALAASQLSFSEEVKLSARGREALNKVRFLRADRTLPATASIKLLCTGGFATINSLTP